MKSLFGTNNTEINYAKEIDLIDSLRSMGATEVRIDSSKVNLSVTFEKKVVPPAVSAVSPVELPPLEGDRKETDLSQKTADLLENPVEFERSLVQDYQQDATSRF